MPNWTTNVMRIRKDDLKPFYQARRANRAAWHEAR